MTMEDTQHLFQTAVENYYTGKYNPAEKMCHKILKKIPEQPDALHLLGVIAHHHNEQQKAIEYINHALKKSPLAASYHHSLAMILLLTGNFERGWPAYEWRLEVPSFRHKKLNKPYWTGEPLNGKTLLVLSEQGYGDTIQFMRYLPTIGHGVEKVIFACPVALLPLIPKIPNVDAVTSTITASTHFDVYVSLLSLPYFARTTPDTIPPPSDFLHIDKELIKTWSQLIHKNTFNVGIAWTGRTTHESNLNRSCDPHLFKQLTDHSSIHFYSLQKEDNSDIAKKLTNSMPITLLGDRLANFLDTAAILMNLDLVITVDTALAHLAATLGKETWLLLPFVPDWRWFLDRDDSPWYPTIQLFRQHKENNWKKVFSTVKAALDEKLSQRNVTGT